ncbi:hypothetical protein AB0M48_32705 [Lentzea sp. NPDC051208]|uniref:hypothetical protein n=1 Tax=Lentzea sp. NPDC051208 TaxID=3154642 RepID=UPI0034281B1C
MGRWSDGLPARLDRVRHPAASLGLVARMPGQVADDAAQYGLTVVIEPLAENSNLCQSGEDAMELMEDIERPT